MPYSYRRLEGISFRILYLQPGVVQDELRGYLEHSLLKSAPRYRALSYAWGRPLFTETLILGNEVLKITQSLAGALRKFRDELSPIALWADQICINQEDFKEREQQVAIMASIYGHAKEVFVWLGEETPTDMQNFWLLHTMASRSERNAEENVEDFFADLEDEYQECATLECPCCLQTCQRHTRTLDDAMDMLETFWNRDWFRRLWVVQEYHIARRATFYCGPHHIDGPSLRAVLDCPYGLIIMRTNFKHICDVLERTSGLAFGFRGPIIRRLLMILLTTAELQCSEKRDRVYAIAPLCTLNDDEHFKQAMMNVPQGLILSGGFIEPDYQIPLAQLWLKIAKLYMETFWSWESEEGDAHPAVLLALPATQVLDAKQPTPWSWVPDFSTLDSKAQQKHLCYRLFGAMFSAGGPIVSGPSPVLKDCEVLRIPGKIISTICAMCPGSEWPTRPDHGILRDDVKHSMFVGQRLFPWYSRCRKFMEAQRPRLESATVREMVHRGRKQETWLEVFSREQYVVSPLPGHEEEIVIACEELNRLIAEDVAEIPEFDAHQILALTSNGRFAWAPEGVQCSVRISSGEALTALITLFAMYILLI